MFRLEPNPTFRAKIKIPVPGQTSAVLDIEFRHKTRKAAMKFGQSLEGRDEVEALEEIIVNWSNCEQDYSRDALAQLIENYPGAFLAITAGYADELVHGRRGN